MSGVRETSSRLSVPELDGGDAGPVGEMSVSSSLPADFAAVRVARGVVRRALTDWQVEEIFDDVVLVASELVANALRHGLQLESRPSPQMGPEGVRISLVSTGRHLICSVTDPSAAPPVPRTAEVFAGSGRGLQLVESLSLDWGWTPLDDGDAEPAAVILGPSGQAHPEGYAGKSVWAKFPLVVSERARAAGAA